MTGLYPTPGQFGILTFSIKRALGKVILMEVNQLIPPTPWPNGNLHFSEGLSTSSPYPDPLPIVLDALSHNYNRTSEGKSCFILYRCSAIMYCLITSCSLISICSDDNL